MSRAYDPCTERYSIVYFNRPEVQKAIHANVTGILYEWKTCSDIVGNYWADSPLSMLPIYKELIAAGLKIWVFSNVCGSHTMSVIIDTFFKILGFWARMQSGFPFAIQKQLLKVSLPCKPLLGNS
ncbi:serine carboxypeptidase, putative [Ricinus communis]|uniref:Serine carboxypeptidase, putative n=1 Tax=Ricinus communis TaxID=3988 RepID=B9T8G0_RICCO|nr:serine carboxypeptidase, putative [Ricinus communis]